MSQISEYWKLSPEPMHPLGDIKHAHLLSHYGRIHTFEEWVCIGFEIGRDAQGRVTQRKGRNLYRFTRFLDRGATEREAITTGKRHVDHFFSMVEYVRVGIPFEDFVSHPDHWRDFCLGVLAQERGGVNEAIGHFRKALEASPDEVRYASKFYELRVAIGDMRAPAQELDYFANSVDAMLHSGRVDEWIKLLLKHKDYAEAARLVKRVVHLLEDKIAGRLPKGQYSGDSTSFVAHKRDQFHKKLATWAQSTRYAPLMAEIERLA